MTTNSVYQDETYEQIGDRFAWADTLSTSRVPEILYHYTDAAGLIGMLSSGLAWATDYRFLNDKTELLYTNSLIQEIAGRKLRENSSPTLTALYGALVSGKGVIDEDEEVFIFSMTEDPDSLSQWRAYSRSGMGFAVGFDAHVLADLAKSDDAEFSLRQVIYDEHVQRKVISEALDAMESRYRRDVKGRQQSSLLIKKIAEVVGELAVYRGSANKHPAFRDEREWRLVGFPDDELPTKVRNRGAELVPFVEFSMRGIDRLPIKRIGIGPGFVTSNQMQAVEKLCLQHSYKVELYAADAPYRAV